MAVVGRTEERDELSLCKELVAWVTNGFAACWLEGVRGEVVVSQNKGTPT